MTHRSRTGGPKLRRPNRSKGQNKSIKPELAKRPFHPETTDDEDETVDRPGPNDIQFLDLIRRSLLPTLNAPSFVDQCQRVKSLLYDRQWLEVFTDPALVKVYAGKWVPSRALCYRDLFWDLPEVREYLVGLAEASSVHQDEADGIDESESHDGEEAEDEDGDEGITNGVHMLNLERNGDDFDGEEDSDDSGPIIANRRQVLSLGGGAGSELLAVGALTESTSSKQRASTTPGVQASISTKWTGIDIGPWHETIELFSTTLNTQLETTYTEMDLLAPSNGPSFETILDSDPPGLITILFTILELFSQSRSSTITLLRTLTRLARPGTLLLVVDSASDLGEIPLGENGRKWPVYMVLDLVLGVQLGSQADKSENERSKGRAGSRPDGLESPERNPGPWELLGSSDSRWYRLPDGVGGGWPVKLENTRYWYRLYRKE